MAEIKFANLMIADVIIVSKLSSFVVAPPLFPYPTFRGWTAHASHRVLRLCRHQFNAIPFGVLEAYIAGHQQTDPLGRGKREIESL